MKVCLVGYQAVSILHGGPSTQIRRTAEHLPDHGVEPLFFDQWNPPQREDIDLVHIFAANIGTYHLARELQARGIPFVLSPITFSLHSHMFVRNALRLTRLLQKTGRGIWTDYGLMADMCEWASLILPNSAEELALIRNGLGADATKIRMIPNGVEERFRSGDPSLFERTYGVKDFILNVGHIGHERKNVLRLVQALGRIDHNSVIIGRVVNGRYGDDCLDEAKKHNQIKIITGLENDSAMLASAYAACNTFVLPSLFETPGIAALEAGLAGAKIVVTPHGGTKEYFGDMARYIDPFSPDSIRDGIVQTLSQKKDSRLQEHIQSRFLWRHVASLTADAYRTALSDLNR